MRVLYFARFRQIVGRSEEEIEIPPNLATVEDLLNFLMSRDAGCASAFADRKLVRVAVNQSHVKLDHTLAGATEIAFFPPVTGG